MKRMAALVLSFGLITAAAASVNAASLLTDQVLLKKSAQETGAQTLRELMTWRKTHIQPQQRRP